MGKCVIIYSRLASIMYNNLVGLKDYVYHTVIWEGKRLLMHIYIIAQDLNLNGRDEERFYKLGRDYVAKGHRVTLFTGGNGLNIDLGQKKIGLLQRDGMTMIAFNVSYNIQMSRLQKLAAFFKFFRLVAKQGRLLPSPDMLVVASPPLSSAQAAIKLKEHFKVPLILEVRELWPDVPIKQGFLKNRLLINGVRRLEEQVYEKADWIVAKDHGIADAVKARRAGWDGITVIPEELEERGLLFQYEQVMEELNQK